MDEKTTISVVFNIYGGSQQILPNAVSAVQHYYGNGTESKFDEPQPVEERVLTPDQQHFRPYINKVEDFYAYLDQLAACTTATELARIVVNMVEREPKITAEEMVKERFILLLIPLAPSIVKGKTVDNIRARINDAWSKRPRKK